MATLLVILFCMAARVRMADAGAGILGCIACAMEFCPWVITACTASCSFGTWIAPLCAGACISVGCGASCAAACALSPTCFDDETSFRTPEGVKRVGALKVGDLVSTMHGNTRVMENRYVPGEHAKVEMHFESDEALVVSDSHWMLAGDESGSLVPVPAHAIQVGMLVQEEDGALTRVKSVKRLVSPGKWALGTSSCTAYANGVLTGTMCGNTTSEFFLQAMAQIDG